MLNDSIKVTGDLILVLSDEFGKVIKEQVEHNLIVTAGKDWITSRLKDSSIPPEMSVMAVGTSSVAPGLANTALISEIGRVSLTTSGGIVTSNTVTYAATFPAGTATGAITEAGILNSANTMLCRTAFGAVNKSQFDSLVITWVISVA